MNNFTFHTSSLSFEYMYLNKIENNLNIIVGI
jgi:hypothetical protein